MKQETQALIEALIAIPSEPDNVGALHTILELVLSRLEAHTIEHFEHEGVRSALVYNRSTRPDRFRVILNVHLDVIPAKIEQYKPRIEGNRLYGAGSMDMKGGAACLIMAFNELASTVPYPLALQLTTDEEVGGFNGAKHQIDQGVRADFVLASEPTNLEIVHKAKGIFQVKVRARGKTAHGAYPWKGDNALWKLFDFLTRVKTEYPNPGQEAWRTTVNLSGVHTPNRAFNKIPDEAEGWLDIRFISEDQEAVERKIRACLPEDCTMDVVFFEPAMQTAASNMFVERLQQHAQKIIGDPVIVRGANGSSDARHFAAVGGAGVEFGPVGDGIGSDEEWVDTVSLESYHRIIKEFLLDLGSLGGVESLIDHPASRRMR